VKRERKRESWREREERKRESESWRERETESERRKRVCDSPTLMFSDSLTGTNCAIRSNRAEKEIGRLPTNKLS
jgi:hypothetical protein